MPPGHKVDGVRPTLERAVTDLDGRAIRLTFSEDLSAPTAPASAFALSVTSGEAPTISDATLSGNIVTLSLESALVRGQVPVVVYTDPTAHVDDAAAVQDAAGNDADSFTTDSDGIPAVDDVVEFVVAADWALKPGDVTAGERFRLLFRTSTRRNASSSDIADYNSFVQARAAAGHTAIQAHSDAFRVLGSTEAVDARDNTNTTYTSTDMGVPIYWLNGAKIADDYEDFYDGSWSNDGAGKNESGADHTNPLIGSGSAGTWTGSKSDGTAGENNQGQSRALGDSFAHFGNPLTSSTTLGTNLDGSFYGMSAVYRVEGTPDPAVNSAPVFESGAEFSAAENQTAVGTVVAADGDAGDVVVYALTGGDDAALLEIGASGGVLRFVAAPDHESPGDADGDNVYVVTVTAMSGTGGREMTATQDVMVTVTDVDEVPVVAAVAVTSTPTAATDTYGFGETIEVTVTFDREVTVTGTPRIQLRVGGGAAVNLKWADYDRGTGAVELVFVYVVQSGDSDDNGIYIEDDELELNSGTIQGVDDDVAAVLDYDGPGQQDGHKVDGSLNTPAAAPGAPTGLSATAADQTAIDLSWTAPAADGGATVSGYRIEVSTDAGTNWADANANTASTATTYQHMGLTAATTYHYRVSAINSAGTGTASNVASATTDAVPALEVTIETDPAAEVAGGGTVTLDATVSGAVGDLTYAWTSSGGSFGDAGALDTTWTAPAATADVQTIMLTLTVTDDGAGGRSATATVTVTVAPAANEAPVFGSGAAFSAAENQTAVGTVVAVDVDAGDVVVYALTGGADRLLFVIGADSGELSFMAAPDHESPGDADGDNVYVVTVTAASGTGGREMTAVQDVTVTVTDVDEVPVVAAVAVTSTPTAAADTYGFGETIEVTVTFDREVTVTGTPRIQLRVGGGAAVNLKWADYESGTGAEELVFVYVVQPGDSDDNGIYIEDDELELNSGTIQGVDDDVAAELGYDGPGQQDGHKVDGSLNPSVAAPGAPTGLSATAAGQTAIDLSWTAPAADGGAPVSGYLIEWSTDAGTNWADANANTASAATTYQHSGLTAATTYHYRVSAINSAGTGTASNVASATTATPALEVTIETDPAAEVAGGGTVTLDATVSGAVGNLTYAWTSSSGSFGDAGALDTTWTAPAAIAAAQTITLTLTVTDDGAGGRSATATVTVTVAPAANEAPVFQSGAAFSAAENQTAVGTVTAVDGDAGDAVVYALTGGDDAALLEIGSSGGVLRFAAAPDHESPGDADRDNVYEVTVTAMSGTGGRELTATQDVMVTVTDEDETPMVASVDCHLDADGGDRYLRFRRDDRGDGDLRPGGHGDWDAEDPVARRRRQPR